MTTRYAALLAILPAALMTACTGMSPGVGMSKAYTQDALPDAVKVPAGHRVALETAASGDITYECRAKANAPDAFEWVFVGPQADLTNRAGAKIGTYYGPPATWAAADGSKVSGAQVAVAPNGAGNIPSQLVKANPATGSGAMTDTTYIQRVATQGGVAPASPCDKTVVSRKEVVKYRADYIFWKAA
jgi:hypothetical protein